MHSIHLSRHQVATASLPANARLRQFLNRVSAGAPVGWWIASTSAFAVLACSLLVLLGWEARIDRLMTVLPGYIRMKPNTALGLGLAALTLLFEAFGGSRRWRYVLPTCTFLIAAATAVEYATGLSLGIDQFLFSDPIQKIHPGRMAQITVLNFLVISTALILRNGRRGRTASTVLAIFVSVSSFFAIVGYAYGVPVLYGSIDYTSMALHTGVSFLLLSLASLSIDPQEPLGKLLHSRGAGGMLVRRLLPVSLLAPLVLGFIFVRPEFNFNHIGLAVALTVISCVILLFVVILQLAANVVRRESEITLARRESLIDGLTGASNRRHFDLQMEKEILHCARNGSTFSLVLVDVDHFKKLNDVYGHVAGDAVLRGIAEVAMGGLRGSDFFFRYGGEEFALLARSTSTEEASIVADRLRRAIEATEFNGIDGLVTISAGITSFTTGDTHSADLVRRADAALYEAKRCGRNCVRVSPNATDAPARTGTNLLAWPIAG